jgi:chorismate dehydratase
MYKIIAVSYSNTLPFIFGIQNSGFLKNFSLKLEVPAKCAEQFIEGAADISLMPVGAMNNINDYEIVSDYCIGSKGKVKSVLLLSRLPLNEIKCVHLDNESKSSVNLVKVLAKFYWKKNFIWQNITKNSMNDLHSFESVVVIGDKAMELSPEYPYIYDLADEWTGFTGLPFVFACWVANASVDISFIDDLNRALKFGIENMHRAADIALGKKEYCFDLHEYLEKNIDFTLDNEKLKALNLFLEYKKLI